MSLRSPALYLIEGELGPGLPRARELPLVYTAYLASVSICICGYVSEEEERTVFGLATNPA